MAENGMRVDTDKLRAGSDRCRDAAGTASAGANELAGKAPAAGIFGAFAEAHGFNAAASAAHHEHVEQLRGHHHTLSAVGEKGHAAASRFTESDESGADSIRAAGEGCGAG